MARLGHVLAVGWRLRPAPTAVGGGRSNEASGSYASVGAGRSNIASGDYAVVSGGYTNDADGLTRTCIRGHFYEGCGATFAFTFVANPYRRVLSAAALQKVIRPPGGVVGPSTAPKAGEVAKFRGWVAKLRWNRFYVAPQVDFTRAFNGTAAQFIGRATDVVVVGLHRRRSSRVVESGRRTDRQTDRRAFIRHHSSIQSINQSHDSDERNFERWTSSPSGGVV